MKIDIQKKVRMTDFDMISSSMIITISPVTMIAISDFTNAYNGMEIVKGDKLINYGYKGEGYFDVDIKGNRGSFELSEYEKYLTDSDKMPITEWWIEIVNYGWLNLSADENIVNYYDREF